MFGNQKANYRDAIIRSLTDQNRGNTAEAEVNTFNFIFIFVNSHMIFFPCNFMLSLVGYFFLKMIINFY